MTDLDNGHRPKSNPRLAHKHGIQQTAEVIVVSASDNSSKANPTPEAFFAFRRISKSDVQARPAGAGGFFGLRPFVGHWLRDAKPTRSLLLLLGRYRRPARTPVGVRVEENRSRF